MIPWYNTRRPLRTNSNIKNGPKTQREDFLVACCSGLTCILPRDMLKSESPNISECDLIRKCSLYRNNQVKIRSLQWVIHPV